MKKNITKLVCFKLIAVLFSARYLLAQAPSPFNESDVIPGCEDTLMSLTHIEAMHYYNWLENNQKLEAEGLGFEGTETIANNRVEDNNSALDLKCSMQMNPSTSKNLSSRLGKVLTTQDDISAARAIPANRGFAEPKVVNSSRISSSVPQATAQGFDEDSDEDSIRMGTVVENVQKTAIAEAAIATFQQLERAEHTLRNLTTQQSSTGSAQQHVDRNVMSEDFVTYFKREIKEADEQANQVDQIASQADQTTVLEKAKNAQIAYDNLIEICKSYIDGLPEHCEPKWKIPIERSKCEGYINKAQRRKDYWACEIERRDNSLKVNTTGSTGNGTPTMIWPQGGNNNQEGEKERRIKEALDQARAEVEEKIAVEEKQKAEEARKQVAAMQNKVREAQRLYFQKQAEFINLTNEKAKKQEDVEKEKFKVDTLSHEKRKIDEKITIAMEKAAADKKEADRTKALGQEMVKAAEEAKSQAQKIIEAAKIKEGVCVQAQAEIVRSQEDARLKSAEVFRLQSIIANAKNDERNAIEKVRIATEQAKVERLEAETAKALAAEKAKAAEEAKFKAEEAARDIQTMEDVYTRAQAELDRQRSAEIKKKEEIETVGKTIFQIQAEEKILDGKITVAKKEEEDAKSAFETAQALLQTL
ncbi:MAG: hypothetical protein A3F67_08405 [Verrucomicrobia bacterium RIFCSPHIGHO2_12_FULL_41_10]|nr:MAG: hypothetical protein A3F67_08405 [Verrucomicrobia bacterium RIFCSPHIGHO2_12_FULL_41_10]